MLRSIIRVLIDSQAWLYANQLKLQARLDDPSYVVSEDQFRSWEHEWKEQTSALIKEDNDAETK